MENNLSGLVEVDYRIIDSRLEGISIFQYESLELKKYFNVVMLKISAITGAVIPPDARFIEIIRDEIVDFLLKFGYSNLTISEIILAFNLNSSIDMRYPVGIDLSKIELFGAHLNVDYISRVLHNYTTIRNLLDRKLENTIDGY